MAIRVSKLMKELNMSMSTLESVLDALGYREPDFMPNTMLPDGIDILVRAYCHNDSDLLSLIEVDAFGNQNLYENPRDIKIKGSNSFDVPPLRYIENNSFWVSELLLLSPNNKGIRINVGSFEEVDTAPLYSVLIGTNGAGKSMLLKEIVDFFIDLHAYVRNTGKQLNAVKGRLRGIKYHIDGVDCEVARLEKTYIVKINGYYQDIKELRLPSIVACHFGAFDKFPTQKVNGSQHTKYDVPYYKYVGAHVNGSLISSSAIAFRLLFALNEQMDDKQRQSICSLLDFIGYDHKISLSYSLVHKSRKDGNARDTIAQRVDNDREYNNLNKQEKSVITNRLYSFYKEKTTSGKTRHVYEIDFDRQRVSRGSDDELQVIYKLRQCDLVYSPNVFFYRQGYGITSEEMSSGEFAMLSTVLSISAAANDPHTLVLLDEPELSLHPNWQMMLIGNLDRALANKACHLLIATHSHMLVSDLPMKRSLVCQVEKDKEGNLNSTAIAESTYGWSAEEVLLKVFKTATDRNRYFGERIGKLLEQMGNNTINPEEVKGELLELQEISMHLSDIDPMKTVLNTIVEAYK